MERFSTCDLREKEVINLCDGTRLGCPVDFEFNVFDGKITGLIVSRPSGFLGLSHANDLMIPWGKIECIGEDAILVRLSPSEGGTSSKNKKGWRNNYF
ncbi:MAG: YlmC/YmxH family sporulation protein [Clostridia bacterium]|nr:YlmC/YmxH family sporulation protein [Clostridia bacterium]